MSTEGHSKFQLSAANFFKTYVEFRITWRFQQSDSFGKPIKFLTSKVRQKEFRCLYRNGKVMQNSRRKNETDALVAWPKGEGTKRWPERLLNTPYEHYTLPDCLSAHC